MTKYEFLAKLKEALAAELSPQMVQDNVDYYSNYMNEEQAKGRSEEDVVSELGDPWAIAKTIIETETARGNGYEDYYEPKSYSGQGESGQGRSYIFGLDSWWKILLLILGIIGVFMVVIAVVSGIISLLAPILVPLIVIMLVIRMLGRRR